LQWDKDDCAAAGLVKFALLGLGMLSVLHSSVDHVREFYGVDLDLAELPQEDEVYDMLCRADSVGVFQVESRAQMATLPRLAPRCFYDLVVEVALIRPGPIQGGSVHPYIRRRNGTEAVSYLHPLLEKSLAKTLGIPLFQEQLMQMAIDVAGFTPAESDQLRQAMGSKRSVEKMQRIHARLYEGMGERGITGEVADAIWDKMVAFANYGFPESHAVSFAYLVYSSAWLKHHYPTAFCAGLLDGQPMGFWSPQTIVSDARRHGVEVRRPDVNLSRSTSVLEACPSSTEKAAVRMGLTYVKGVGKQAAERVVAGQPYLDMEDFLCRSGLDRNQAEVLGTGGAFDSFGITRRSALWAAGALSAAGPSRHGTASFGGLLGGLVAPTLPSMTPPEVNRADLWATGLSPDSYPTQFLRPTLQAAGVLSAAGLAGAQAGQKVTVAGVVTHRQRPATAQGVTFINLEDETGLINVVCSPGAWARYRKVVRSSPALVVRGRLERADSVTNVIAEFVEAMSFDVSALPTSRDFR
jgi:error-prone DNA polymerase